MSKKKNSLKTIKEKNNNDINYHGKFISHKRNLVSLSEIKKNKLKCLHKRQYSYSSPTVTKRVSNKKIKKNKSLTKLVESNSPLINTSNNIAKVYTTPPKIHYAKQSSIEFYDKYIKQSIGLVIDISPKGQLPHVYNVNIKNKSIKKTI